MDLTRRTYSVGIHRLSPSAGPLLRATSGSSGYDLSSAEDAEITIAPGAVALVRTGISLELHEGMEAQVRSRSGLAAKSGVFVLNSPGTIDSDYRGEVKVILANLGRAAFVVRPGDRVAQMVFMLVPDVLLTNVEELTETDRGAGGFGSTGV